MALDFGAMIQGIGGASGGAGGASSLLPLLDALGFGKKKKKDEKAFDWQNARFTGHNMFPQPPPLPDTDTRSFVGGLDISQFIR